MNNEAHCILIKATIHQENIMIVNIYNFIKQMILDKKRQIDPDMVTVCDFNTPLHQWYVTRKK
jgi:hypothetical protein